MHYAARAGYDDLIIKLVSLGGSVKLWDCVSKITVLISSINV